MMCTTTAQNVKLMRKSDNIKAETLAILSIVKKKKSRYNDISDK